MGNKEPMQEKKRLRLSHIEWGIIAVAAVLICAMLFLGVRTLLYSASARESLSNAKMVRLAAWTVSTEQYATGAPFADQTTESGFANGVVERIILLSRVPGDVWLTRVGTNGYDLYNFAYTEGEYLVTYRLDSASKVHWAVYRGTQLISAQSAGA